MDSIIKVLEQIKELSGYSVEVSMIFLSMALFVGFVAVCLLAIRRR